MLHGIAALLFVEVGAGDALHLGLEPGGAARSLLGATAGAAIGLASSLLGVAGGELIIPTLVFGFGLDIKAAGTASLLVSLPTVAVGVLRFRAQGAYRDGAMLAGRWRCRWRSAPRRAPSWAPRCCPWRRPGS